MGKLLVVSGLIPSNKLNVKVLFPKTALVFLYRFQGEKNPPRSALLCHPFSKPVDAAVTQAASNLTGLFIAKKRRKT